MVDNLSAALTAAHDDPARGSVAVDRTSLRPVDNHLEVDVLSLAAVWADYFRHTLYQPTAFEEPARTQFVAAVAVDTLRHHELR